MKSTFYIYLVSFLLSLSVYGQDLQIQHFKLQSQSTTAGGLIYPHICVSNTGSQIANASKIGFYLSPDKNLTFSDTYLGESGINAIFSQSSDSIFTSLKLPDNIPAGKYFLFAFADYAGQVFETNEKNNSEFLELEVSTATLDLIIDNIYPSATSFVSGGIFSASISAKNNGNIIAANHYNAVFFSYDSTLDASDVLMSQEFSYLILPDSNTMIGTSFYLPNGLNNGDYYIIAQADYGNNLSEVNENNNTKAVRITITDPVTDLTVIYFKPTVDSASLPNVTAGTSLYTFAHVVNSGNYFLSNVSIGYYLSADSVFNIGDTFLSSNYIGWLYSGNNYTDYSSILIPSNLPEGKYYILAVADHNFIIEETYEENNVKALPILVSPSTVDLSLSNLYLYYPNSSPGSYNYVNLNEFNNGTSYTGYHNVSYYLSRDSLLTAEDQLLSQSDVSYIAPESYTNLNQYFYIPDNTEPGIYYVIASADNNNNILETNEDNNILSVILNISSPFTDLTVKITGDSSAVSAGSYFSPLVYDYNNGNQTAYYHNINYYLSSDSIFDIGDTFLSSNFGNYVYPGGYNTYNPGLLIPANAPEGTYYVIAVTDYPSYIIESDEENNTSAFRITIIPSSIDLLVSFVSSDSVSVTPGSTLYPYVLDQNLGTSYAPNHSIAYFLSKDNIYDSTDIYLNTSYVFGLNGGEYQYLTPYLNIPSSTAPGNYHLLAITDYLSEISETNETNNTSFLLTIIKDSRIDLSIHQLTIYPNIVTPGSTINPGLYEFNDGSTEAQFHYTGYYLSKDSVFSSDDIQLGYEPVYLVAPGNYTYLSPYLSIPYYLSGGNYYLIAKADIYSYINEYDETNNEKTVLITIRTEGTDLSISSLTVNNNNPDAGSFIYPTATETNEGNISAGGHFIGYYLSTDSVYNFGDIYLSTNFLSDLPGSKSTELNPAIFIPHNVKDGKYFIIAIADYGYSVTETDEFNNTRAIPVTIGKPYNNTDLVLSSLYSYKNIISVNSYFNVNYTEINNSPSNASYHEIVYFLSSDDSLSFNDTYLSSNSIYGLEGYKEIKDSTQLYIPYATTPGKYFVIGVTDYYNQVQEANEANNSTYFQITVTDPIVTGTSDVSYLNESIKIYPNPSNGVVNFSSLSGLDEIKISDINGQDVLNVATSEIDSNSIDLSKYGAGVYFVKAKNKSAIISNIKLIITK